MTPLLFLLMSAEGATPEPLVEVTQVVTDAVVDLRYATKDNFMKKAVYPKDARCLLLKRTAEALEKAAQALRKRGYRLRLYDCYRPASVQEELWKVLPRPGYVADPKKGSNHSRGGSVDLGLVKLDGSEVELPSAYDFFGAAAHHSFTGGTAEARAHRDTLREAMEGAGFKKNPLEWWHYDLPAAYGAPLRDEPIAPRP